MSENDFYFSVGSAVGITCGVIALFIAKHDDASDSQAFLAGGCIGIVCGLFWPFTLGATLIGLIGIGSWYGWKSMRSIFDE